MKLPTRDADVRTLAIKKLGLCKKCVNKFTKQTLSHLLIERDLKDKLNVINAKDSMEKKE